MILHRPPSARHHGLAGAVLEGFRISTGEWRGVMDADLRHPPEALPQLWAAASGGETDG